jgi:hypothetical protein
VTVQTKRLALPQLLASAPRLHMIVVRVSAALSGSG